MSQARKLDLSDYSLVEARLKHLIDELETKGNKSMHQGLSLQEALEGVFSSDHAYIVGSYLVLYDIGSPWYSPKTYLVEQLVLNLSPTRADFSVVAKFLEQAGREAGVDAVVVGTALARSDRALARLYQLSGFKVEALTLTKEL